MNITPLAENHLNTRKEMYGHPQVFPGDIVHLDFGRIDSENRYAIGVVDNVYIRYGKINRAREYSQPLLAVMSDTQGLIMADNSFVVGIERAQKRVVVPANYYQTDRVRRYPAYIQRRGKWQHNITSEDILLLIGNMSITVPRPVHLEELIKALAKQDILQYRRVPHIDWLTMSIDVPRFKRWLKQNINRYLKTVDELIQHETELNLIDDKDARIALDQMYAESYDCGAAHTCAELENALYEKDSRVWINARDAALVGADISNPDAHGYVEVTAEQAEAVEKLQAAQDRRSVRCEQL